MDKTKIQEKLKKIRALAERGIGGEKETAQRLYKQLLEKYDLTDADISEKVEKRWVKYKDELSKKLAIQIFYKVTGSPSYFVRTDKRYKEIGVECTEFEYAEIMFYYNFYAEHFRDELNIFIRAFFNMNNLFPDKSARCYSEDKSDDRELTPEELRRLEKMFAMQHGMERKTPNLMIEEK